MLFNYYFIRNISDLVSFFCCVVASYVVCGVMIVNYIKTRRTVKKERKQSDIIKKRKRRQQNSVHIESFVCLIKGPLIFICIYSKIVRVLVFRNGFLEVTGERKAEET